MGNCAPFEKMGLFALEEEANLFFYSMRQRSKRYVQTDSN